MKRETWAEVSVHNLKYNHKVMTDAIANRTVFPVVKANAYGHGMVKIAQIFEELDCEVLCVSSIEEALILIDNGIKADILIFGKTAIEAIEKYNHEQFIYTITSLDWFEKLPELALRLHLEVNTGMNRVGVKEISAIEKVMSSKYKIEGLYTHFASNQSSEQSLLQLQKFQAVLKRVDTRFLRWIHVGNMPLEFFSELPLVNAMRLGISLYGYHSDVALKPVISLYSHITHTDFVTVGETIGYDYQYKVNKAGYFATIPVGYADGFEQRQAECDVLIHNKGYKIVGKICMDQLMIWTDSQLAIGSKVELIGPKRTLKEIYTKTGISPYEVLSRLSTNIIKIYQ